MPRDCDETSSSSDPRWRRAAKFRCPHVRIAWTSGRGTRWSRAMAAGRRSSSRCEYATPRPWKRRLGLKRRDDALDGFVLVVADTRRNRATIASEPGLFADLPRLRAHRVIAALEAGVHPPSALIFL
jgi:hypothetical protein